MTLATQRKITILRRKQVEMRTGLSRSTIYQRVTLGTFPSPIRLGAKSVGWLECEIEAWISKCLAETRNEREGV